MGCDIHLKLEIRLKKDKVWNKYYTEKCGEWKPGHIFSHDYCWSDRIYGMFAALAGVRNYGHRASLPELPKRGFPTDCCDQTANAYGVRIADKDADKCFKWECPREEAQKLVNDGWSEIFKVNEIEYVSAPNYHSPNWCTTQEMEKCFNDVFLNEDGTYKGDYIEWMALLGAMKGYEASGEYECRAVFWFDN